MDGFTVYVFNLVLMTSSGVVNIDAIHPAAAAHTKICFILCYPGPTATERRFSCAVMKIPAYGMFIRYATGNER
jgi:hypothetical protein